MIKTSIKIVLFLQLLIFINPVFAQDLENHEVKLLARPLPDSIMLRWAPTTYQLWLLGNKYGYLVSRSCLMRNGVLLNKQETQMLTELPLKPVEMEQWEIIAENNDLAGVAAEAIYGDRMEVETAQAGGIIDIVNKATEQESKFGFALLAADRSPEVATLSGLMFVDRKPQKNEKYLYRVWPAYIPAGLKVDTGIFFTGVDEYLPLVSVGGLTAEGNDKMMTLTWQQGNYSGFYIERATSGNKKFERLNETPMLNTTPEGYDEVPFNYYVDTLPQNGMKYQYRVIAMTPFGELTPPSEIVSAQGIFMIKQAPVVTNASSPDNSSVSITWEPLDEKDKVDGYNILRSKQFESGYEKIGQVKSSIYQYRDVNPIYIGYYRVQAYNGDSNGPSSLPRMVQLIDSVPPAIPVGLTAVADTTGKVVLQWNANHDDDIFGYRVFRANRSTEEFSQLTTEAIIDTFLVDTIELKTLTKDVFYQIVAVDKRQNSSMFSASLRLERPDIVPPAPPQFKGIESINDGIALQWFTSPSFDVLGQLVYRKENGTDEWILIAELGKTDTMLIDTSAMPGVRYHYLMLAIDKAGNESKPTSPIAGEYNPPQSGSIWITPKVKVNKKEGTVELSWDKGSRKQGGCFLLYGMKIDSKWYLIQRLCDNEALFISQNIYEKYTIKCLLF